MLGTLQGCCQMWKTSIRCLLLEVLRYFKAAFVMNWWHLLPRTTEGVCTREGLEHQLLYIFPWKQVYVWQGGWCTGVPQEMGKAWRQPSSSFCIAPGEVRDFSSWFHLPPSPVSSFQGPQKRRQKYSPCYDGRNEHWAQNERPGLSPDFITYQLRNYPISLRLSFLISGENAVMPASWVVAEINGRL